MATGQLQNLLKQLRKTLAHRRESEASDGELLERFFVSHDEEAFELLVWRHHRMVLGVCSRILADSNDIEDAFQGTFLVLARKGRTIRKRGSLSSWLYGVARRVALEASREAKQRQPIRLPLPPAGSEPLDELMHQELRGIFDEELGRLPEKYRAPVVLCYLEGMTYEEAAQRLGWSKGTISTRLTRARELLRSRLARRGLATTAGALMAWLCESAASAGAPSSLVEATIKVATSMAAGQAASSAVSSTKVAALAEGVMKALSFTKLKAAVAVVLMLGVITAGVTILTWRTMAGQGDKDPFAEKSVKPAAKQEKQQDRDTETATAWSKEIGGPQAGLGFRPGEHRLSHEDERVTLEDWARNFAKDPVKFPEIPPFIEQPLLVRDSDGKLIPQPKVPPDAGGHFQGQGNWHQEWKWSFSN